MSETEKNRKMKRKDFLKCFDEKEVKEAVEDFFDTVGKPIALTNEEEVNDFAEELFKAGANWQMERIEPCFVGRKGIFIPLINKVLAMHDSFGGKPVPFEKATMAPTMKEWRIILFFEDKINELLKEHGGDPLKGVWYWSSTSYSKDYAWHVDLCSYTIKIEHRKDNSFVRALSKL